MIVIGWLVMAAVACASLGISSLVAIGGTHPLEAMIVAIILGVLARNIGLFPKKWEAVLKKFETPLLWGIVALGAGFSLEIASDLPLSLLVIILTMLLGYFFIYFLGRKLGLSPKLSTLLAVGTTICGGSAVAITAPIIKAKEEETSYAVSTIVIAAFIMMFALPVLGHILRLPQAAFGIWAGTAVHNTPQTIATGFIFGEEAGQVATIVKLSRNMFMILVAVLVSVWFEAKEARKNKLGKRAILEAFPWVLFGYIAMAFFAVKGFFSPEGVSFFKTAGKFLIIMGMVGIGFGTNFRDVREFGLRPLVAGIIGAVFVSVCSLFLVKMLGFF